MQKESAELNEKKNHRMRQWDTSGKNLFIWTKYSGYDPDVNIYGNVLKYGVDMGAYPAARTYMFDLKVTF